MAAVMTGMVDVAGKRVGVLVSGGNMDLNRYAELLHLVADGYLREGKRYVTLAVGCTGGKHRSVALAEALASRLGSKEIATFVVHRDLGQE